METTITTFIWLRPQWLWLLIPTLLLIWLCPKRHHASNPWQQVCDPHLLATLSTQQKPKQAHSAWPKWLLSLAVSCVIAALAGPSWQMQYQPVYSKDSTLVIALDMSPAMLDNDLPPNRLTRAKYKLRDFLATWSEGSIGLIAYTKEAFIASPLTTDTKTLSALLPSLQYNIMPVRGSDATAALTEAADIIQKSHFDSGNVLLITASHIPDTALTKAAELLKQKNIHTHVYALRDDEQYQQLVNAGSGHLQRFSLEDTDIKALHQYFQDQKIQQIKKTEETFAIRLDQGFYFLWLVLPLTLLAFRRGWLEELVG